MKLSLLFAASLFVSAATAAPLPGAEHDPHKLSAQELRLFLPAVCRNPVATKHGFQCAALIRYPADGAAFDVRSGSASGELSLDTVAYGHFTAPNAQEAYVTYSGLEPHSDGFGGGILLRGSDGGWKPVRWIAGGQMDHCVAFPDPGPQRMLCLSGYTGMGETDSSVWVLDFGAGRHAPARGCFESAGRSRSGRKRQRRLLLQRRRGLAPRHVAVDRRSDALARRRRAGGVEDFLCDRRRCRRGLRAWSVFGYGRAEQRRALSLRPGRHQDRPASRNSRRWITDEASRRVRLSTPTRSS